MIDSQYYEAQCYIRGTSLAAAYHYTNGAKSDYTYYVQNARGDVVNLTDVDGAVTKTYHYDAFGVEQNINATDTNAFRYCGEYYDAETGTIYLRARYYQTTNGRFLQKDTNCGEISNPLSLNLYTYCINNPIIYVDTSGNSPVLVIVGGLLVVSAVVYGTILLSSTLANTSQVSTSISANTKYDSYWQNSNNFNDVLNTTGRALTECRNAYYSGLVSSTISISLQIKKIISSSTFTDNETKSRSNIIFAKPSKKSGKEKANDIPSWARGQHPEEGESGKDFAERLCDEKYGKGNYKKGPNSDYNKIKKWGIEDIKTKI